MSEQGGESVNPGQAIYDALSDEAKESVDALPDDVFAGEDGRAAASVLAWAIRICHQAGPTMWTLLCDSRTSGRGFMALNVAMNNMLSWDTNGLRVVVDMDSEMSSELDGLVRRQQTERTYRFGNLIETRVQATEIGQDFSSSLAQVVERTLQSWANQDWQRNQRANEHRDDWRVKLALLTSSNLSSPLYVPEHRVGLPMEPQHSAPSNPGQAIYDALSDEAKVAVDSLPNDLFTDAEGVDHSGWVLESVRMAHQGSAACWALLSSSPKGKWLALNVSSTHVMGLTPNRRFMVQPDLVDEKALGGSLSPFVIDDHFKSGLVMVAMDSRTSTNALSELERVYRLTVSQMAKGRVGRQGRDHRDDVRVKLALLTGEYVPPPAYLPESTYGLPSGPSLGAGAGAAVGAQEPVSQPAGEIAIQIDVPTLLPNSFASVGLTYTDSQIAAFYTALQTKGFVILSGISGTGKSKIAQRFADMLPRVGEMGLTTISPTNTDMTGDPFVELNVRDYMAKFQRFHIPVEITAGLPLPEPGTAFNVPLAINGIEGEARIRVRTSSGAYLFPKAKARAEFVAMTLSLSKFYIGFVLNETGDLIEKVEITGDSPNVRKGFRTRLTAGAIKYRVIGFPWIEATKFLFPALSPSKKIPVHLPDRIVEGRLQNPNSSSGGNGIELALPADSQKFFDELAVGEELILTPFSSGGVVTAIAVGRIKGRFLSGDGVNANSLFLPVRPDWRDGKGLIGYHNPLTGEYVRTGFLDFVIAAAEDFRAGNRNAFFVILDEMNLAHVEYYFADVLSVIESGRDAEGWTVEGIPLAVGEEDADLPERLQLPPNLYIVGTVNMDETTHPFSPKVLDRAFTIELTEVDFSDYPPGDVAGDSDVADGERQALLEAFTRNGRYPRIDKDDIRGVVTDHPRFRADLANLNTSLKRYRMHFGYRVFDEIMQFVHNAEVNGMFSSLDDAFDHAVLMKVLPKFTGSRAKLERALLELIVWSRQSIDATSDDTRAVSDKFAGYVDKGTSFDTLVLDAEDWRYPATGRRAALMMQDLYTDGFAAFG